MKQAELKHKIAEFIAQKEASAVLPPHAGLAVAVVEGSTVRFCGGFGHRQRDPKLPVTPDTLFEVSSLTKSLTAAALLVAEEEGRVDLNASINQPKRLLSLSDPEISRTLTLTDILSHQTGLPANDLLWYLGMPKPAQLLRSIGCLELIPGAYRQTFSYSNLMYGALGHLFPKLVGKSWQTYVSRKLLAPLGMRSAVLGARHEKGNIALPYVGTQRIDRKAMSSIPAAGALACSLRDMTRWLQLHLSQGKAPGGKRLLSTSSIGLMQSAHARVEGVSPAIFSGLEWLSQGKQVDYGLGWFLSTWDGHSVVFHPGLIDGFSVVMLMVPDLKLGFVVMTNVNLSCAPGLLIQNLLEARKLGAPPPQKNLPAVIGKYKNPAFGLARIVRHGDAVALQFNGHVWPLAFKSPDLAELSVGAFGVQFPLTARFELGEPQARQMSVHLSLDPRVKPEIFKRV